MVDALGNPIAFFLTPGQAHDLEGADALLPQMQADALLADKAFDADERVIEPLREAGKTLVIPPKSNRKVQRTFDREMYKARHLIENFFCQQAVPGNCHTLRQDSPKFPRCDPLGRCYHLAQLRTGPSSIDVAVPPVGSPHRFLRAREIRIDDALRRAPGGRGVALTQRRIAAFIIGDSSV